MKCPHCLENFNDAQTLWPIVLGRDDEGWWAVKRWHCPTCRRFIFALENGAGAQPPSEGSRGQLNPVSRAFQVWPKGVSRAPVPTEVPPGIAEDYKEACLVLSDSPKASAALSRRCLQAILRDMGGAKKKDLNGQIEEVIKGAQVPTHIADGLHAVRTIGNFAAHPTKSTTTGAIIDVEIGEAEWNLDVLELLFDFYFVQPAVAAKRKAELNKKLKDAGKPELP